jgi:hypothetical protein
VFCFCSHCKRSEGVIARSEATKQSPAESRPSPGFVDRGLSYTLPLMVELLIGLWTEIIQRRVSSSPVVERFDVEKQVRPRLVTGAVQTMLHPLAFQGADEALHGRVVVPSADARRFLVHLSAPPGRVRRKGGARREGEVVAVSRNWSVS